MKQFTMACVVVILGIARLGADEKAIKELEGTYKTVSVVHDGKTASEELISHMSVHIVGDEIVFTVRDKNHPARFKIDTKPSPAHIDLLPSDGPEKGKTFLGIYKQEKGELVIAFTEKGDRPTEFRGEGDVRLIRLKLEEKK